MIVKPTSEQESIIEEAVQWFRSGSEQVFEFSGKAGTGKSVVLNEIINRIGLAPPQYIAGAYTGAAAIVMRIKGFRSARSLHSIFYHLEEETLDFTDDNRSFLDVVNTQYNTKKKIFRFVPAPKGIIPSSVRLIVIDEGYMVPKYMRKVILKHGIKVLVCGDRRQLPPIGDDAAFLTGTNVRELTQIMRQNANDPIIYLANRAIEGLPIHCGSYGPNCMVIEDRDLTDEMLLKVGNVICGTNKSRDFFNHRIRELRGISSPFPVYADRVICRNNNWGITNDNIALANGLTGYITSPIDPSRIYNGKDSRLYGTFRMDFLPDLLQYPFRDLNVNYEYLVSDYSERNKIKNNRYTNGELFEYANAITTHLSQGSEYPAGIFYEEFLRPQIQNQLNYTGITRFKKYLIYVKKTKRYY